MSIAKLRVLAETIEKDYPEQSLQYFLEEAIIEIDKVKEKAEQLINACALHGVGDLVEVCELYEVLQSIPSKEGIAVSKFDEWYDREFDIFDIEGCSYEHNNAATTAWNYQQERINKVIERLEDYPCCMSCYLRVDEVKAAKQVKEKFISILKEGLL